MTTWTLRRRIRAKLRTMGVERLIRTSTRTDMMRLGSTYGGWWIPRDLLDENSVCYLAGVGEDVTFDLALIGEVGCDVYAMDPTPRAIEFAQTVSEPKFHFLPQGVWSEDANLRFYEPSDPAHVSHSVINAQATTDYFTAHCSSVRTFMSDLGHDRIDLLKMDIEGAEVRVIEDLLLNGPLPTVLCVEFDAPEPIRKTLTRVKQLRRAGYRPVTTEGLNATFILTK